MAKRKVDSEKGILNLIKFDEDLIEDGTKSPNILIDDCAGIVVDKNNNWELVKISQTTVTEDNIKSTTNVYGEKYTIGDTYQEWTSFGKYLDSYISAIDTYLKLRFNDGVSKLSYCKDIKKLIQIQNENKDIVSKFAFENTLPQVVKEIGVSMTQLQSIKKDIEEARVLLSTLINECNDLTTTVSEKRIQMIAKGIIDEKKTKHRVVEEE